MTAPVRVLLADDQRVVRDGLVLLLGLLPRVEVVGTAGDGEEAVDRALQQVVAGQAVIDPAVQHHLVDAIAHQPSAGDDGVAGQDAQGTSAAAPRGRPLPNGLTPREAEVLQLIAAGLSNAEIAGELVVSEATVKSHINHLLAKIGARDRAQAVSFAYQNGIASA